MALIDSCNPTQNASVDFTDTTFTIGQSFTGVATKITSCVFVVKKTSGTLTGNAVAKLYAHSGTYGTDSIPTGSALATSDTVAASTFSDTGDGVHTFTFSEDEQYEMSASTKYCIALEYLNADGSNYISIYGGGDGTDHNGNPFYGDTGDFNSDNSYDLEFWVYGEGGVVVTTSFFNIL